MINFDRILIDFEKLEPTALILVVEDETQVRDSVRELIEEIDYSVETAKDEDEAVERARRKRPHLLIVNLHEPVFVDLSHPSSTAASRICERARLDANLMMVTHTDVALTVAQRDAKTVTYNDQHGLKFFAPQRANPQWRKECFAYTGDRMALKMLLSHWLEF
jgi:CheY-like chemotaxis protein